MAPERPPSTPEGRGRVRRWFRLAGLVLQVALCSGLVAWFAASGEALLLGVAVVLGLAAVGLLVREVRASGR